MPPPINTYALNTPANTLRKNRSNESDTAPDRPINRDVKKAEKMKMTEGDSLLKSHGELIAPKKYPPALAVFMVPATRYDQFKSSLIIGRKRA